MAKPTAIDSEDRARYEVLPFASMYEQAARLPQPVRVTVTCSPTHGPDRTLQVGWRVRERGHAVTVHIAARIGVGPSLRLLRKQRGLRRLLSRRAGTGRAEFHSRIEGEQA